jgi:hypothetical protein
MQSRENVARIIAVAALAFFAACATTTAPSAWLPSAADTQTQGFGSWISLTIAGDTLKATLDGELIAVEQHTVLVLTRDSLIAVNQEEISAAKLTSYRSGAGLLTLWTVLGVLSTPSHGWFMGLTVPLWIITGSVSSAGQSFAPQKKYPNLGWHELRQYARFPQGLPRGIDREGLSPKPY